MGVNPTSLSKMLACAIAVGAISSSTLFGQQATEYQIVNPASQSVGQPTANEGQQVIAPLSDQSLSAQCDSCSTNKQCGCQKRQAKPAGDAKPNPCAGSHKPLFYTNNFDYLDDPDYCGSCLGDQLKGHKVGPCGNLDIGGQLRFRYHSEQGMGQRPGQTRFQDTQNDFTLSRLRLYGDWKVNNRLRFYAEGIYAAVLTQNTEYVPRIIDNNFGDFLNLFADVRLSESTIVRVGRQELLYGPQRVISPLDWANTRRTFDGVRTISKFDNSRVDIFWTQPVLPESNDFDSGINDIDFYGTYVTYTGMENKTLDFYVLALNNNTGPTQTENFVTYGTRLQGSTKNAVLYETEAAIQSGRNQITGQAISANAWMTGLGYQFKCMPWKPTLWGFFDYASGDAPGGDFNRYNQLFPLAHKYLGFIDAVARSNIESPNLRLTMAPSKKLSLLFWYYNFQADEAQDLVRSIGGTPAQDPTRSNFGNELDCLATYKVNARSSVVGGYSHLWRGGKIIGDTDADFFYLQWTTNF